MAYDVKKTDHLFIPFSRLGSALRDSKNNTKIYKDRKTLEQHNRKSHDEPAWLTSGYYVDVVEYAPVVNGHWIDRVAVKGEIYCSECGTIEKTTDSNYKSPFCPKCGARLIDGECVQKCRRCGYFKRIEPSNFTKRLMGF